MIADLIARAGLTQEHAARRCGVSLRTIQNWVHGRTQPTAEALAALEFAAADVALETAPEMTRNERLAVLRHIRGEQEREISRLEFALANARQALTDTTAIINLEKSQ